MAVKTVCVCMRSCTYVYHCHGSEQVNQTMKTRIIIRDTKLLCEFDSTLHYASIPGVPSILYISVSECICCMQFLFAAALIETES